VPAPTKHGAGPAEDRGGDPGQDGIPGSGAAPTVASAGDPDPSLAAFASTVVATGGADLAATMAAPFPIVPKAAYEIIGEHARGGLGRVLLARDKRLERVVAIKVLARIGLSALGRFQREALLTAKLQHPAIVPVIEAGYFDSGEPFYAMKFVAGRPLRDVIAERASLPARLELLPNLRVVCDAMAYAHAHGIIHRDLKPSNVLVGDYGETVVVDWGLAKDLADPGGRGPADAADPEEHAEPLPYRKNAEAGLTTVGTVVGTPAYMPPEQAAGQIVDQRADVYALGAMLYHTLVGAPPYQGTTSDAIVQSVLAGPPPALATAAPTAPAELVAIATKAMAREPGARYADAGAFTQDLARFQAGQLVGAFRYSRRQLALRFARRHRLALAVAAAALVTGGVVGGASLRRIVSQRDAERAARAEAVAQTGRAEAAQRDAERQKNEMIFTQAKSMLGVDPTRTIAWLKRFDVTDPQDLTRAQVLAAEAESRGVAKYVFRPPGAWVNEAFLTRNHRWVVSRSRDGGVTITDLTDLSVHGQLDKQRLDAVLTFSTSADLAAYSDGSAAIHLFDGGSGESREFARLDVDVLRLRFAPSGARLVALGTDGRLFRCEIAAGACVDSGAKLTWTGPPADLEMTTDGRRVAFDVDGEVYADLESGGVRASRGARGKLFAVAPGGMSAYLVGHTVWFEGLPSSRGQARVPVEDVTYFESSEDGAIVAVGTNQGDVSVIESGQRTSLGICGRGDISRLALSENGEALAATDSEGTACVWNRKTGEFHELVGHQREIRGLALTADGGMLTTASGDGEVRVWRIRSNLSVDALPLDVAKGALGDRGELVVVGRAGGLAIRDKDAESFRTFSSAAPMRDLDVLGAEAVTADRSGAVLLWSLASGTSRVLDRHDGVALSSDFVEDGKAVISVGQDGQVRRSERTNDNHALMARFHPGPAIVALSAGRDRLAIATTTGELLVWSDLSSVPERQQLSAAAGSALAWSPKGDWLAWAGTDGRLSMLRADGSFACQVTLPSMATALAVTDASGKVVLGTADGDIVRLDSACGQPRVVASPGEPARLVVFVRGRIVVGGDTGSVWVFDPESDAARTLRPALTRITFVAADPLAEGLLLGSGSRLFHWFSPWPKAPTTHVVRTDLEATTTLVPGGP
jgi:WD40 repeat protein